MKIINSLFFVLSILFLQTALSFGQTNESEIDNTKISILTCRSGDELYSTFGHTAIRIFNPKSKLDQVYNYGLFSFDTPNFYLKFMRGQLPYFLGSTKMKNFLSEYQYEQRSIFEQELILSNDQKQKIIEFLIDNSKPENRAYEYDFFFDNCATRVVDVYSLVGNVSYSNEIGAKTFRDLLKENLRNLVWSDFGIDLVIGARADKLTSRRGQMFLPEYVMTNLSSGIVDSSSSLAMPPHLILDFESMNANRKKKGTNWPLFITSILFIITLLLNIFKPALTKTYNKLFLLVCALLGFFLLFMWFGTNHNATRDNWNVLWLNPLIIIYLFAKRNLKHVLVYILIFLLCIAALNCLVTFLPQFFNIAFLPIIMSALIILYFEFIKNEGLSAKIA